MKKILLTTALVAAVLFCGTSYAQENNVIQASSAMIGAYTSPQNEALDASGYLTQNSTQSYGESTYADLANSYANDLLVYPNPVESSTRIVLNAAPNSEVFVDIVDLNGQVDRTFQYPSGSYQLDVDMSKLPTGLYSVRVSGKDAGYHNLKVFKE